MNFNFAFKNRNYSYNPETEELRRITDAGGSVPVTPFHPSLSGIREHIQGLQELNAAR